VDVGNKEKFWLLENETMHVVYKLGQTIVEKEPVGDVGDGGKVIGLGQVERVELLKRFGPP
jgi:hypothetical protein